MVQAQRELQQAAEEMKSVLSKNGLNHVAREVDAIMRSSKDLAQFRQKVYNLIKKRDPEAAKRLYQQAEGQRYWERLKTNDLRIELNGAPVSVKDALTACAAIQDENKRLERFQQIIAQVAEKFRLKEKGGERINGFGISYDILSSDPHELFTKRSFNCISGSIILGQMIMYAASQVDVQQHVSAKAQLVASYKLGGNWDDDGHIMLRVDIKGKPLFFDSSNTIIANHASNFILDPKIPNQVRMKPSLIGTVFYKLGEAADLTPKLMDIVQFQDRLFDMQDRIDNQTASQILKIPPTFITYFVGHLDKDGGNRQKLQFFEKFGIREISKIKSPSTRFKLSAIAASLYAESDPKRARTFGALALTSLGETIANSSERARIPLGNLLNTTINLVKIMRKDNDLLVKSGVWAYLPFVISNSAGELSKMQAAEAREFLTAFYEKNNKIFDGLDKTAPLLINCMHGLITLNNLVGTQNPQTEAVLNALYAKMGINRSELLASLRNNAATSLHPSKDGFLASSNSNYLLEVSFLNITGDIFSSTPRFSLENLRYLIPGSPITGHAVYTTLKENLHKILFAPDVRPLGHANKDLRVRAKELGLV